MESMILEIEKVTDNIFAVVDRSTIGNVAAFVLPSKIAVIDSGMNIPLVKKFREHVEKESNKKTEILILTHFHGDHIFGNQVFSDCRIIATKPLADRMTESLETDWTEEKLEQWKQEAEDPSMLEELEITLPNETFDEEMQIKDKNITLQIKRTGGHTEGSTYVYCPEYKALVAGDNLFIKRYPWGGDKTADPDKWIDTLEEYLSLEIDYFIPGHGSISTKEEVQEFLDYLRKVKQLIQDMNAKGKNKEEILKACHEIEFYPPSREESKKMTLERWYEVWGQQ
ncbi:MAG: MBL fold metallo-hydrolase [Candidatus Heimdallarchaeota archaeon]|nr:MBL fold metallo-hydrolase [Candidatus Heimdallarchaeota archaeon]